MSIESTIALPSFELPARLDDDLDLADMLARRFDLACIERGAREERGALDQRIRDHMGDRKAAICTSWKLKIETHHRPEYTVAAQTVSTLTIRSV